MKTDLYDELDVARDASPENLTRAYRRRAKETHPDTDPGNPNLAEKFRRVQHAYEVLSDPERRKTYDETGDDGDPGEMTAKIQAFFDMLMEEVDQAMERGEFVTPFHAAVNALTHIKKSNSDRKKKVAADLKKASTETAHWKKKGEGHDFIGAFWLRKRLIAEQEIASLNATQAILEAADASLQEYIYTGPKRPTDRYARGGIRGLAEVLEAQGVRWRGF